MRVTRLSGSEGGGILCDSPYPYSDSPPVPNNRGACHPCADSSDAGTCLDATIRQVACNRVGLHYTHVSAEHKATQNRSRCKYES